jgi:hypothetical protein
VEDLSCEEDSIFSEMALKSNVTLRVDPTHEKVRELKKKKKRRNIHFNIFNTFSYFKILYILIGQWSEFLATDPEARVRFPAPADYLGGGGKENSSGSGTGFTLSFVSTTEELLDRKVVAHV